MLLWPVPRWKRQMPLMVASYPRRPRSSPSLNSSEIYCNALHWAASHCTVYSALSEHVRLRIQHCKFEYPNQRAREVCTSSVNDKPSVMTECLLVDITPQSIPPIFRTNQHKSSAIHAQFNNAAARGVMRSISMERWLAALRPYRAS